MRKRLFFWYLYGMLLSYASYSLPYKKKRTVCAFCFYKRYRKEHSVSSFLYIGLILCFSFIAQFIFFSYPFLCFSFQYQFLYFSVPFLLLSLLFRIYLYIFFCSLLVIFSSIHFSYFLIPSCYLFLYKFFCSFLVLI